jgi:hypothetical protein
MEEEKKVVYSNTWGSTVCEAGDDSVECQFQRFMYYFRSILFIIFVIYGAYLLYTEYAPKSLKSLFKSK